MSWSPRILLLIVLLAMLVTSPLASSAAAAQAAPPAATGKVLGYYVPYDPSSWVSLQEQARALDVVAAQWVSIDACGSLSSRDNQTLKTFARANGIAVYPSLLTSSGWLNHQILNDPAVAARAIEQIAEYVTVEGYEGFDLDLEGVRGEDRQPYTAFVVALGSQLHQRGKALALALPPKTSDVTTGWAGAFDYAALGSHADVITIMAYDYSGAWGSAGPVAPYPWVESVLAFTTSQIPAEKVFLGLASYGYDWNLTSGGVRALGYGQASRLAERYQVPITLDPTTQSATFRYQARAGDPSPAALPLPTLEHEITVREAPPCVVTAPAPPPKPAPTPTPPPDEIHDHVVWLEESASAVARLGLAGRYRVGGVATWRLGLEDSRVWPALQQWRGRRP